MSCLVYDYTLSITDWLHTNGIFNKFIHSSINTIVSFASSRKLSYSITIDDTVSISVGIPVLTTFKISANSISYKTLGVLRDSVDAWDVYTDKTSLDAFIQNAEKETSVFDAKQDVT